jgi:hypothetical protein
MVPLAIEVAWPAVLLLVVAVDVLGHVVRYLGFGQVGH